MKAQRLVIIEKRNRAFVSCVKAAIIQCRIHGMNGRGLSLYTHYFLNEFFCNIFYNIILNALFISEKKEKGQFTGTIIWNDICFLFHHKCAVLIRGSGKALHDFTSFSVFYVYFHHRIYFA